jgi:lipoprotein-anchoring transpeptidase ErfK/SrfK
MPRTPFIAAFVTLALLGSAEAASSLTIPRPPSMLSPDLAAPRPLESMAGSRAAISELGPRTAYLAPLSSLKPKVLVSGRGIGKAFLPRTVSYRGGEPAGTVIIDTRRRFLYLVLGGGEAKRYGVGVGRPGFEWAGVHAITQKAEWPTWTPPEEMRQRKPDLPVEMAGGPDNPLGARALYLGDTLYRIHGSNEPWTIGHAVSSGCIRMRNEDVIDLYERVKIGTRVIVL